MASTNVFNEPTQLYMAKYEFKVKCMFCQKYARNNQKEPLMPHLIKKIPWYKVGMDIYELYGENYLLVVDYYSKYAEILNLNRNMTARAVIKNLKTIFARHGIPAIVISDSGTQLISQELQKFAEEWKFQLNPSSPHHQQGNGMAERTIQTIKNLLRKTIEEKADIDLALLAYRNTPIYGTYTPSQILMSRMLRDNVPRTLSNLTPQIIETSKFHRAMEKSRENSKRYYDRNTKARPDLNNLIYYQEKPGSCWKEGKIISKYPDRSYKIETQNKKFLRRNKQFLRRRGEEVEVLEDSENDEETEALESSDGNKPIIPTPANAQIEYRTRYGRRVNKPRRFIQ